MKKRKGFSIVEAVIAVALSLIMMAAVTAVTMASYTSTRDTKQAQGAVREAKNILVCYQSDNFVSAVQFLYGDGSIAADESGTVELSFDGSNAYVPSTATAEERASSEKWRITCTQTDGVLKVTATETKHGKVIYETDYTKATAATSTP